MQFAEFMERAIETSVRISTVVVSVRNGDMNKEQAEVELVNINFDEDTLKVDNNMLRLVVSELPMEEWHVCETHEDGTSSVSMEFYCMDWIATGRMVEGRLVSIDLATLKAPSFMELLMDTMRKARERRNKRG